MSGARACGTGRRVGFGVLVAGIVAAMSLVAVPVHAADWGGEGAGDVEILLTPDAKVVLEADPAVANTSIPVPDERLRAEGLGVAAASFEVTYQGAFPPAAKVAFEAALDVWEGIVSSAVPIGVEATWTSLSSGVLAQSGPVWVAHDFPEAQPRSWYGGALANALTGTDMRPSDAEIGSEFSSSVSWYFGTDGHPAPGQYDFMTVVLHEIGHGLGLFDSMSVSGGQGSCCPDGRPTRYDWFLRNGAGTSLGAFTSDPAELASQLTSNSVYFSGRSANAANGGQPVRLFAPSPWSNASIAHLSAATFPPGNPNSLMTPSLSSAESIHAPGPVVAGILRDLGWSVPGATPAPNIAMQRVFGTDAIDTSLAISQRLFTAGAADAAVLARSDHFSDALAGGPLAVANGGPLLITPGASISATLDPRVLAEIDRVVAPGGTVFVLGGPLALAFDIDAELASRGYTVQRVSGQNQFSTATAIADRLGNPDVIFEATGLHFADALSAVPAATKYGGAILLTNGSQQAPETAAYLATHTPQFRIAVGGPLAAAGADPGAFPVFGQDLFGTAVAVAATFFDSATTFGAATGRDFPDALSGGVFMSMPGQQGPMLLLDRELPLPGSATAYLHTQPGIKAGFLFGGPLAVGEPVLNALATV